MPNQHYTPKYTAEFKELCRENFNNFIPFATITGEDNNGSDNKNAYSPENARKLLKNLDSCNPLQLEYINEFAEVAKAHYEDTVKKTLDLTNGEQAAQEKQYTEFFKKLEEKLKKSRNKSSAHAENANNNAPSSYKPSAPAGQSIYDAMMHTLGYDPITVGASAMFFLAFSGLRFLVGSPYWEQMAEYAANPKRQFNPEKVTEEQIAQNLDKESTREQILQAGYLPPPDLASAFEVEFKTFMQKVGHVSKQNESAGLNQLGAKAAGRR